jgi:hypothetical protein
MKVPWPKVPLGTFYAKGTGLYILKIHEVTGPTQTHVIQSTKFVTITRYSTLRNKLIGYTTELNDRARIYIDDNYLMLFSNPSGLPLRARHSAGALLLKDPLLIIQTYRIGKFCNYLFINRFREDAETNSSSEEEET